MPDGPLPMNFPTRGLDLSRTFERQPGSSTPVGVNVRVCDPSTYRLRGGRRPGTRKYVAGQVPSGTHLVQELNHVVVAEADGLSGGIDDPGTTTVVDPSSPGPPSSWGTGALGPVDYNVGVPYVGTALSGSSLGTRAPGVGGSGPLRRHGGSGRQPNKNKIPVLGGGSVTAGTGAGGTAYCTSVTAFYAAHVPPATDLAHFNGQAPSFNATVCEVWTTIDDSNFAAEVAANKARIAAKADRYIVIQNLKAKYIADAAGKGSVGMTLESMGATVLKPNPLNVCDAGTPNPCNDPNYNP